MTDVKKTEKTDETEDRNLDTGYKVYEREPDGSLSTKAPVAYVGHVNLNDIGDDENADR